MSDNEHEEKDLSVEEIEEDDNQYIDDGLDMIEIIEGEIEEEDGKMEVDSEVQESIKINNIEINTEFDNFKANGEIYSVGLGNNGVLVIGDSEEKTYFYDLNTKELIRKDELNKDSVCCVAFSRDGKYLVTAGLDGKVNLYETTEYKLLDSLSDICNDINVYSYIT
jgi:WD40 repeat protein